MRRFVSTCFCLALILAAVAQSAQAADTRVRLLVQSAPLAGLRYYAADQVWSELQLGDTVRLMRDPSNPHDGSAIGVHWQGHMLGYVPRRANGTLSWALDRGDPLRARISRIEQRRARRLEIEVYVE